jgi:hypothetical protein
MPRQTFRLAFQAVCAGFISASQLKTDCRLSQRGAVETQIGHNIGKVLSVQLGDQGVDDIH